MLHTKFCPKNWHYWNWKSLVTNGNNYSSTCCSMKNVHIRSYCGPYFPAFGLNVCFRAFATFPQRRFSWVPLANYIQISCLVCHGGFLIGLSCCFLKCEFFSLFLYFFLVTGRWRCCCLAALFLQLSNLLYFQIW